MANWNKRKVDSSNINNGQEFNNNSVLTVEELNAMVNNSFYSVDFVEAMADDPDIGDIDKTGTPSVSLINNDKNGKIFKKFKFSNLRGKQGEKGETGERGETGEKGEKGEQGEKGDRGSAWFLTPNQLAISGQIPLSELSSTTSNTPMVGDFIINNMYDNNVVIIGYIENDIAYYDHAFYLKGDKGDNGNGIRYIRDDGINANGDHEYTIFLDDDTYYVFTAPKGEKGEVGATFEYDATTKTLNIITG